MRKHLSFFLVSLCLLFIGTVSLFQPVRAHIVGAFQDFLLAMEDNEQTEKLAQAVEDTEGKYEDAKKQKKEQQALLKEAQDEMVKQLVFYDTVAFDTYASFIGSETELVDVLGNNHLMKKQLDRDKKELEALYGRYKQWAQAVESVEGYRDLLFAIQDNQSKKQELHDTFPHLKTSDKESFATLLQATWTQEMAEIDELLIKDASVLSKKLSQETLARATNGIRTLSVENWNALSSLTYLVQSDHIYIVYEKGRAHTILVTRLQKHPTLSHSYYLEAEAGFLNGYPISAPILEALNGLFVISYEALLEEQEGEWMIAQQTNRLLFQPLSRAGD